MSIDMRYSVRRLLSSIFRLGRTYTSVDFGSIGEYTSLPENLIVSNPKNIYLGHHVQLDSNSCLYATNAPIIIKDYFVSAQGLKIATGQHERRIGRFLGSINEEEKNHSIGLDSPVVINEDVWAGFNVTILAGVEIGRGCTLAAGAVVTKATPPYSIVGGNPAKFIKFYWTIDEIISHELELYEVSQRLSRDYLEHIFEEYKND